MDIWKIMKTVVVLSTCGASIALFILVPKDRLGYGEAHKAEIDCMVAYGNLMQIVLDRPVNNNELLEVPNDVCSPEDTPDFASRPFQQRTGPNEKWIWFWQDYERQRAINLALAKKLSDRAGLIDFIADHMEKEVFRDKKQRQEEWEAVLADLKGLKRISATSSKDDE